MQINAAAFHKSTHLNDNQLEPLVPGCPFCGFNIRHPIHVLQGDPKVLLLKCTRCYAASASRMPTNDALREYYIGYYKSSLHSKSCENITFDNAKRFAKHLVNVILRHQKYQINAHASILDFGGGDGSISYAVAIKLLEQGFGDISIIIIDHDTKTVLSRDSRISIKKLPNLDNTGARYNIIIASAIIEHLCSPREPLSNLFNLLEDEGVFYARTPCITPLMRIFNLIGINWDFTYPAHIHDLGQDFWETYFEMITLTGNFKMLESNPSIIETTLKKHFLRTMAAYLLKVPWYLLGRRYKCVGGWEVFIQKNSSKDIRCC